MALIICKICNNQISASADVCPHCGHPHAKDKKAQSDFKQILAMLALVVLFLVLAKTGLLQKIFDNLISFVIN